MVNNWYTLVVGILLSLNGIIFLIFPMNGFKFPNWYLGLLVLIGVVGVILGIIGVAKKKASTEVTEKTTENTGNESESNP